jgi:tetratricopeptide (TPR) repeat protein
LAEKAVDFTLKEFGPDHSRTASAYSNLGAAYFHLGRNAEAEQALLQSLAIWEKAENPDLSLVATALINLAEIYKVQGRLDGAEVVYRRAVTLLESTPTPDPSQLTLVRYNLSEILRVTERCALAEPIYGEILEDTKHTADRQALSLYGMSLNGLAICLQERKSYAAAKENYQKACKVMAETMGPNDPNTVVCLLNLSDLEQEIAAGEEPAAEELPAPE